MEFVAVTFNEIPIVRYAHVFEAKEYSNWNIQYNEKIMEITFIEKGALEETHVNTNYKNIFREGDVYMTHQGKFFVETVGDLHKHVTFATTPNEISPILSAQDVFEMSTDVYDDSAIRAIVPILFEPEDAAVMSIKINKIVDVFNSGDTFRCMKSSAILMDILSYCTTRSMEMAQKDITGIKRYNHTMYCQQAIRYIAEHINEPIDVEKIADSMSVSYGHLSRLFKKQTNHTLVDYINKEKVRKMEELLWTKKMSVSEIANGVGINDEKYAARLFRKYTGLTMSSYVKMHKK